MARRSVPPPLHELEAEVMDIVQFARAMKELGPA
jgi:hypothetical protein